MRENTKEADKAPSSSEEGVGGGGVSREMLLARAKAMRNNPTEAERRLWNELRDRRLAAFKFRRQAVIGNRIVDFFCPEKGLVVEIDGHTHERDRDDARDRRMRQEFGFRTVRYTNEDVLRNRVGVMQHLIDALNSAPDRWAGTARHHPQTPSSGSAAVPKGQQEGASQ